MGLGFFIAKTLLERSGATVSLENRGTAEGAVAMVSWRREVFEGRRGERASRERGRNCQWQGRMRIYLRRRASRPIYPDLLYKAWASGGKPL